MGRGRSRGGGIRRQNSRYSHQIPIHKNANTNTQTHKYANTNTQIHICANENANKDDELKVLEPNTNTQKKQI